MPKISQVVVIGAGVGGLAAAATLARAGASVTVLEAHVYPGGCAGTFFHQQYRFDAGATLAGGFYPGGPMDLVAQATGVPQWPIHSAEPAMTVHLPDGSQVTRWGDERRKQEHERLFGATSTSFWTWQEQTADALWDLALQSPAWPPQTMHELFNVAGIGGRWLIQNKRFLRPTLYADLFRPVAAHLLGMPERLRLFIDGQLLIAAQATSAEANALYGAAALDLPRRGVAHLAGGMGAIAESLVKAIRTHGGSVYYRQEAQEIARKQGRPVAVKTKRGESFPADWVIANLPPWNIAKLLKEEMPAPLANFGEMPPNGWGAFMLYVGIDAACIPADFTLHHQVILRQPLGEGNSIFLSISPAWDVTRAPKGKRAITISTHTALKPWWRLFEADREQYERQKQIYTQRLLMAVAQVLPQLEAHVDLILPGTPVTFQRFTRRQGGWVGGFPQTSLFQAWGPTLAPGLWMVGDSIFPGQSTAAVALGGVRVANAFLKKYSLRPATTIEN